ncbi:MAG: hypothetical protein JJ920_04530 [Roseitalea sp.]|jgi:hypothetical protein|nr:hypothetical protein [Roseitalea sp.]MBO6723055.1 hypothetical protein [Roseitalea sp.]MBO6742154.1 hypothetical protein [Roseitalea sp.]
MAMPITATITMTTETPKRPRIETITTGAALKDWYWLKQEIVDHARNLGVSPYGGKFAIIDRVAHFLDTGERRKPSYEQGPARRQTSPASMFDWAHGAITRDTIIDAGYRNNHNVRAFLARETGRKITFNIAFMDWMKANAGKTMGDAAHEWLRLDAERKAGVKATIPYHNQFNAYVRAFFDDNPGRSMDDARHFWKLKRGLPGHNRYERSDLDLTE